MLHIFWSILNLLVLGLFFYACYRVARHLQQHVGAVLTVTFVLGLLVIGEIRGEKQRKERICYTMMIRQSGRLEP